MPFLYTGSSMAAIDETALPVALPAIQSALGATAVDAQWVVAAYTLLLAALILIGGSLGDHLGRASVKEGLASGSLDA
jgi:MFS family permease